MAEAGDAVTGLEVLGDALTDLDNHAGVVAPHPPSPERTLDVLPVGWVPGGPSWRECQ